MSLQNIRAYANIHIFCVGFYPDAGAGPSSSSFRADNETFTLDDFDLDDFYMSSGYNIRI